VIIISYLDRAFRSIRDAVNTLHRWDAMGVRVIIVGLDIDTGTPMGKLIISILAAVAQFQSDLMSEKNRAVQQHRKRQGFLASGTIPFGFKRASRNKDSQNYKRLVADNEERRLIRRIAQLYESTDLTYDDISDLLEREAAEREGRSVLPRNGLRGTKHKHLPKRRWSFWRCKRAIAAYRNGLVPPPTDEPLPPEWAEREKAKAEKLGPDPMDP
jgi:DNA invertase Pin-like site-specific DNA recombinase